MKFGFTGGINTIHGPVDVVDVYVDDLHVKVNSLGQVIINNEEIDYASA